MRDRSALATRSVARCRRYSAEEKKAVLIDQYAALGLDLATFLAEEE